MVRYAEPSNRSEHSCTRRKKFANSSRLAPAPRQRLISCQPPLIASHISMVSAVRTARALVRATSKQLRIEEGLAGENARNSVTVSSFASSKAAKNALTQPAVDTALSHSFVVPL